MKLSEQCKTCLNREYREELLCCQYNQLCFEIREMLKLLPFVVNEIRDYECGSYLSMDRRDDNG